MTRNRLDEILPNRALMIPGPVPVEPQVLREMAAPLVPHYGTEWAAFYHDTMELLRGVHFTSGRVFLLVGAGSAGLDAAIGTALAVSPRVLVLKNGFFGERIEEIARTYSDSVTALEFPWGQPVRAEDLQDELAKAPAQTVVATHCETSTGVLNPIRELAEVCRRHDSILVVDAISSLAVEPLLMDEWGVDVCVSASQKGLGAPPGLSTVAVSEGAWERLSRAKPKGWYLSLPVWDRYEREWEDWHPHPVTHAVNNVRSLHVALRRILDDGIERHWDRQQAVATKMREGLRELGVQPTIEEAHCSHGMTTASVGSVDAARLLEVLRTDHQVLLGGGLGSWKGKVIRVGHMGPCASEETVGQAIEALRSAMTTLSGANRKE